MKVKLFTSGTSWGKPANQFASLEEAVNAWLDAHPGITINQAHQLSQPTFGWGQLAIAFWYEDAVVDTEEHLLLSQ